VCLRRRDHVRYLYMGLDHLPSGYASLDASRPWVVYWITHSLELLGEGVGEPARAEYGARVVAFLGKCRAPGGGYGGGPQQLPHLAPTYAAVLALLTVGTPAAYASIDRAGLYAFFLRMKAPSGGFRMHEDGEVDVRATYTALCVATLLNMCTEELKAGAAAYVLACQSYEGGFGGEPCNEAHGGYVFCAYASLVLLGAQLFADVSAFEEWLANRQMEVPSPNPKPKTLRSLTRTRTLTLEVEGGFQGRPNKLVDSCYSFWQGGAAALLEQGYLNGDRLGLWDDAYWLTDVADEGGGGAPRFTPDVSLPCVQLDLQRDPDAGREAERSGALPPPPPAAAAANLVFNPENLQRYILFCAQHANGGLRDKPDKYPDYYHTCYSLSGLAAAQFCHSSGATADACVVGDAANRLNPTNAIFNIRERAARRACQHFRNLGPPST